MYSRVTVKTSKRKSENLKRFRKKSAELPTARVYRKYNLSANYKAVRRREIIAMRLSDTR